MIMSSTVSLTLLCALLLGATLAAPSLAASPDGSMLSASSPYRGAVHPRDVHVVPFVAVRGGQLPRASAMRFRKRLRTIHHLAADDAAQAPGDHRGHPHQLRVDFAAAGRDFEVHLFKNHGLFAPGYKEVRGLASGEVVSTVLADDVPHCHYHGYVATHDDGDDDGDDGEEVEKFAGDEEDEERRRRNMVAMSTCGGQLTGTIHAFGETYLIEPAAKHLQSKHLAEVMSRSGRGRGKGRGGDGGISGAHIVMRVSDIHLPPMECGMASKEDAHKPIRAVVDGQEVVSYPAVRDADLVGNDVVSSADDKFVYNRQGRKLLATTDKNVELFVMNDVARKNDKGTDTESLTATIVNTASNYYINSAFNPSIQLRLVSQKTFLDNDPYTAPSDPNNADVTTLLNRFNGYRSSFATQKEFPHDNGALISGYDFLDSIVGYAGVGTMCIKASSGSINQGKGFSEAYVASTLAHELGHNLDMQHDGESCTADRIMSASSSGGSPATLFSSCSKTYYNNFLTDHANQAKCLNNEPTKVWSANGTCGNGFVEDGEQCDCGSTVDCDASVPAIRKDLCCNASSCQLLPSATCSDAEPCCESCSVVTDNRACRNATGTCDLQEVCDGKNSQCPSDLFRGTGYSCGTSARCMEGACISHQSACLTATEGVFAGTWSPCQFQEQLNSQSGKSFCGTLYCHKAGDPTTTCRHFTIHDQQVLVENGVPCSTTGQCVDGACVEASTANEFKWNTSAFVGACLQCDTPQNRSVECRFQESGELVDDAVCSGSKPDTTRNYCINETIGCFGPQPPEEESLLDKYKQELMYAGALVAIILVLVCLKRTCCGKKEEEMSGKRGEGQRRGVNGAELARRRKTAQYGNY